MTEERHYVMRSHSHTDKQLLWKVMSRGFEDIRDAGGWMRFCAEEEKNPNHEFFVVTKVENVTG